MTLVTTVAEQQRPVAYTQPGSDIRNANLSMSTVYTPPGLWVREDSKGETTITPDTTRHEPQLAAAAPPPNSAGLQQAKYHISELLAIISQLGDELASNQLDSLKDRLTQIKQRLTALDATMKRKAKDSLTEVAKECEAGLWGKIGKWLGKIFAVVGSVLGALGAFAHGNVALGAVLIAMTVMAVWDLVALIGEEIAGKDFMSMNAVIVESLINNHGYTREQAEKSAFIGTMVIIGSLAIAGSVAGFFGSASSAAKSAVDATAKAIEGTTKAATMSFKVIMSYVNKAMALLNGVLQLHDVGLDVAQYVRSQILMEIQAALLILKGDSRMQNEYFQMLLDILQECQQFTQDMARAQSEIIELQRHSGKS